MDADKKKKLEDMLQGLLERELNQQKEPSRKTPTAGGRGGVIRRRKGQPDKRVPRP